MNFSNDRLMSFLQVDSEEPNTTLLLHPSGAGATTMLAGIVNAILASQCSMSVDTPLEKPITVVSVSGSSTDIGIHMRRLVEYGSASDGKPWINKPDLEHFLKRQDDSVRFADLQAKWVVSEDAKTAAKKVFNEIRQSLALSHWQANVSAILLDGLDSLVPLSQSATEKQYVFTSKYLKHLAIRFTRFAGELGCPLWMTSTLSGKASQCSPLIGPNPGHSSDCRYLHEKFDRTFVLGNSDKDGWLRLDDHTAQPARSKPIVIRRNDASWFDVVDEEKTAQFLRGSQQTKPIVAMGPDASSILRELARQHEETMNEKERARSLEI